MKFAIEFALQSTDQQQSVASAMDFLEKVTFDPFNVFRFFCPCQNFIFTHAYILKCFSVIGEERSLVALRSNRHVASHA